MNGRILLLILGFIYIWVVSAFTIIDNFTQGDYGVGVIFIFVLIASTYLLKDTCTITIRKVEEE